MENKRIFTKQYIAVLIFTIGAVVAFFVTKPEKKAFFKAQGDVWTTEYHITYEATADLSDSIGAVLDAINRSANVLTSSRWCRASTPTPPTVPTAFSFVCSAARWTSTSNRLALTTLP